MMRDPGVFGQEYMDEWSLELSAKNKIFNRYPMLDLLSD